MKQSSKRLTSVLFSLLFIVVAFVIFFDFIEPTYANLEELKGTQLGLQQFYANEQTQVQQAKTILSEYENSTQAEDNLALAMPSGPDIAGGLAQVYGIASANGIAITNVSIQAPTVQLQPAIVDAGSTDGNAPPVQIVKPVGTISFQLVGSGSYEAVKNFLQTLETNIRIFDVTAFSIQPAVGGFTGKGSVNSDLFNYNITVVTYYQLP